MRVCVCETALQAAVEVPYAKHLTTSTAILHR